MNRRSHTCLLVACVALACSAAEPARADFFDRVFGVQSVRVPNEGTVLGNYTSANADYDAKLVDRPRVEAMMAGNGYGLVPSKEAEDYLNRVLAKILAVAPEESIPAKSYVVASMGFNAVATPDGGIYVDLGILQNIESEDELAFLLSHELGHIIFQHHGSDWFTRTQYNGLARGMELRGIADKASTTGARVGVGTQLAPVKSDLDQALAYAEVGYAVSEMAIAPSWQREQEEVADAFGLDLMIEAGYNPVGATTFLERMDAFEQAQKKKQRELAGKTKPGDAAKQSLSAGDLEGALNSAFRDITDALGERLGRDHYPADVRLEVLQEYLFREYRRLRPAPMTDLPWASRRTHPVITVMDNYQQASAAMGALSGRDLKKAELSARKAIGGPTARDSYPRLAFYSVRYAQGQRDLAQKNIELAMKGSRPALAASIIYIDMALERNEWDTAEARLQVASKAFNNAPQLLPQKIRIFKRAGREKEAAEAMRKCKEYDVRNLSEACEAAAGGI